MVGNCHGDTKTLCNISLIRTARSEPKNKRTGHCCKTESITIFSKTENVYMINTLIIVHQEKNRGYIMNDIIELLSEKKINC